MSQPLNLAIVGTGIFATDTHLPTIQKLSTIVKPIAAYNRTKSKAETFASKAGIAQDKVYDSLEQAFQDPEVQFVDALLPVQFNLDAVKLAIENKKPICFEKPIAANLEQAKEIVQLSEKTDLPIAVLENWSFRSATTTLTKEIIPKLGDIVGFTYHATGPWNDNNKYLATGWRLKPEHIGGFLSDGGVHQLALLTDFLGEVDSVSGLTKQVREQSGTDDVLFSTMKLKSGVIGTFTYGSSFGATDKATYFTIFGTKGSVTYDWSPSLSKPTITYQLGSSGQDNSGKKTIEVDEVDTFEEEFKNFAEAVTKKEKSLIIVPPRKAFHHLAIVAAALESSKNNGSNVKVESP
ncbi:hypothetical protein PVL30_005552 [Lodderomyces elongisporus]|uniref:uncharacterized protein n=1 Tax=Lodderomyces elongisporus TaxID=36914 RepID=UPI002926D795|nr:uncharacterized protein PVL30_005552 [Lodderomyces elongisporus]WLF81752.1 hypothetical protein PVL30_005552 [Lodderomyces elongisporus]